MRKLYPVLFAIAAIFVASFAASAQMMKENPMVGGAAMYPTKTIVANAMNSADHTTLVAAVKAAGLVDTLNSAGPFTVFAPTNAAFEQLPAGTVEMLLKPENKADVDKGFDLPCRRRQVGLESPGQTDHQGQRKGLAKNCQWWQSYGLDGW